MPKTPPVPPATSLARMGAEFSKLPQMPIGAPIRKPMTPKAKRKNTGGNLGKWLHPRKGGK